MSKPPVDWAFQEVVASSKLDQMTQDETRRGDLIIHAIGTSSDNAPVYMGWFYYNPAKSTFNRLRLMGWHLAAGVGLELQYSLDGGVTWTNTVLSTAGIPAGVLVTIGSPALGNYLMGLVDIDLSAIVTAQWIGVRKNLAAPFVANYHILGYLHNSVDTPF